MNRKDLQELSKVRLKEANALCAKGLYDGAYYLAGYAVECALKACIAKKILRYEFPDKGKVNSSYTHNLLDLISVAGLKDGLKEQASKDRDFQTNWEIVQLWSEQSRYQKYQAEPTRELLAAIGERNHGVVSWIKRYW